VKNKIKKCSEIKIKVKIKYVKINPFMKKTLRIPQNN
jgi:hypothetical protein